MVKIPIKSKEDDTLLALIDQHIVKGKTQYAVLNMGWQQRFIDNGFVKKIEKEYKDKLEEKLEE